MKSLTMNFNCHFWFPINEILHLQLQKFDVCFEALKFLLLTELSYWYIMSSSRALLIKNILMGAQALAIGFLIITCTSMDRNKSMVVVIVSIGKEVQSRN